MRFLSCVSVYNVSRASTISSTLLSPQRPPRRLDTRAPQDLARPRGLIESPSPDTDLKLNRRYCIVQRAQKPLISVPSGLNTNSIAFFLALSLL